MLLGMNFGKATILIPYSSIIAIPYRPSRIQHIHKLCIPTS